MNRLTNSLANRRAIVAAITACALAACSSSGNKVDYKAASSGPKVPTLEVPPDLTRPGQDDRYSVPDTRTSPGSATASTYNNERSQPTQAQTSSDPNVNNGEVLPNAGLIKVVRDGSERWLVVPQPPEKIWPVVRDFWQDNGFLLKVDSPQTGVMETDWAENRARVPGDGLHSLFGSIMGVIYSTGERDKFRTRLERGADPNSTEIYVSHRGMVETIVNTNGSAEGSTLWQPRQPDPGLEAGFLRRLMLRFGVDDKRAQTSLAVAAPPDRARLRIGTDGAGLLEVTEPFDRAWRRVGLALDRVGFTVEDRDRANGQYFVRYIEPTTDEPQKKTGLLSWIGLGGSSKPKPGDAKDQYRVQVRGDNDQVSEVSILNKDGNSDSSSAAKRILALLQEQLR